MNTEAVMTSETAEASDGAFSKNQSVEAGLKFKTISGLIVETTGRTEWIGSIEVYVHEVVIIEGTGEDGVGEGNKYLHNLDAAEQL